MKMDNRPFCQISLRLYGTCLPSELSNSIRINIIHFMLARRDQSAVLLPLQHAFQQSKTFANIDGLELTKVSRDHQSHPRRTHQKTHLTLQRQNIPLPRRPQINHIQTPRSPKRTPVVRLARDRAQQPRGAHVEEETLGRAVQGSARVQVFALDWEAEGHLGVGGRVFEGGGHFEGFHPVQVEGGWAVFFGVGDDLGRFFG